MDSSIIRIAVCIPLHFYPTFYGCRCQPVFNINFGEDLQTTLSTTKHDLICYYVKKLKS